MLKPIIKYFSDVKNEGAKVTWPTREQTIKMTITVIIFSAVMAILLGVFDYTINLGVEKFILK